MNYFSCYSKNEMYVYSDLAKYAKMISLSSFLLQKNLKDFSFYCDNTSFKTLQNYIINESNIKLIKQTLPKQIPSAFWSYPKIHTANRFDSPFCCFDIDLLLWDSSFLQKQSKDFFFPCPDTIKDNKIIIPTIHFLKSKGLLPERLMNVDFSNPNFTMFNFGFIGCNNTKIFKKYYNEVMDFFGDKKPLEIDEILLENKITDTRRAVNAFSVVIEQVLLSKIIHDEKASVNFIYPDISSTMEFPFDNSRYKVYFTHLMRQKRYPHIRDYLNHIYDLVKKEGRHSLKESKQKK